MEVYSEGNEVQRYGHRYPVEVIDIAFELWAFKHARNATDAARELLRDWDAESWGVPPDLKALSRAMQLWAKNQQWSQKVRVAIAAIAPHIDTQIIANNMANALKASIVMGKVLDGEFGASEGRTRAYASQIAFNHAGYDAASMLERIKEASANRGAEFNPAALAQLSPDELAARADRIRRGLPLDALPVGREEERGQVVTHPSVTPEGMAYQHREDIHNQQNDDISPHQDVVDNLPSTSPYADGRDSSGRQEDRREAESQGSATHESHESR